MTEELHERYTEDKEHFKIIREIFRDEFSKIDIDEKLDKKVNAKMTGIKWMLGVIILVYISVAGPLSGTVIGLSSAISTINESKASKEDLKKAVDERQRDYVQKLDYFKMEVDEHSKIKEAIENPSRAEYVLKSINDHIQLEMNLNYTTARGVGIK
jgi:hypothetical protein